MRAEVDLHHISLLQHHLIARIRCVVSGTVVDAQTARETHTALEVVAFLKTLVTSQSTHRILDALSNLRQGLARLDGLLRILTDLTVHLGTLTVLLQEIIVHAVEITLFFVGRTVQIIILVLDDLALRILLAGEELRQRDPRGLALNFGTTLLLLLRLALLLFLGGYTSPVVVSGVPYSLTGGILVVLAHLRWLRLREQRFLHQRHHPSRPLPLRLLLDPR